MLFRRYGKAQYLKDAQRLGLGPKAAFSRAALRRRRDRLLFLHHPDRGGDANKAVEINAIYERMLEWLEGPGANWREAPREGAPIGGQPTLFLRLGATKAKLSALALAAVATYAVFRGGGKR